jgi:hypothetical protein
MVRQSLREAGLANTDRAFNDDVAILAEWHS